MAFVLPLSPSPRRYRNPRVCLRASGATSPPPAGSGPAKRARPSPRLFVLELEAFLPGDSEEAKSSNRKHVEDFLSRVLIHRKSRPLEPARVVYSTRESFPEALLRMGWNLDLPAEEAAMKANAPLPDVLLCLAGLEVYQQGYKTPDPYWRDRIMKDFDSKPARWVASKFFEKSLRPVTAEDDHSDLRFARKLGPDGKWAVDTPSVVLVAELESKLADMGLQCRVLSDEQNQEISIIPAQGSVEEAVQFVQTMLQVQPGRTIVFGNGNAYRDLMTTRANLGVIPDSSDPKDKDFSEEQSGRVFITPKIGAEALQLGIVHHAFI